MRRRPDVLTIYRDTDAKWRWHLGGNNNILADSGQGYRRRIDATKGAARTLGADYRLFTDGTMVSRPEPHPPVLVEVRP